MQLKECRLTYGINLAHCVLEQFVKVNVFNVCSGEAVAVFIAAEEENCTPEPEN